MLHKFFNYVVTVVLIDLRAGKVYELAIYFFF